MFVCPKCRSIYSTESEFCGIDGTRLTQSKDDPLIGLEIDRYKVVSRLGTGAMGYVYLAQHKLLDSKRAFKLLFGELAADRRAMNRFQREAQALSKIRHPNIVSIIDFGTTQDGLTFLAMEYIQGQTLEDLMEKEGEQLSTSRIANITRQISSGLAEAHKLGFVHRDLKPGNVMITLFDDSEQIKVLDFGLVAIADEAESVTRLTKTGYTLGTPRYLAPEQSQSAEVTSSADLYSLGVILYEMIAGKPPFVGDMKTVIMQHLCESPPALPAADGLEALAMSLLEKEPAHRPASAAEVVNILDELSGKIKGSDMFMSLRAVSDPRDSLAPRRNSSPGINTAIDGETLDKLATAETALKPQDSWAPQLPLTDPAATGPSIELISQFPKPTDDRVILHPKKITAVVALVLILSGISLYIMNELGMLREETVRNVRNPVHVKPVEPIDKKPTEQPNNLEAETEAPSAVAAPSSIPKKSRALARKNPVAASRKSAPIKSLDTKLTAQEIKSLENKLRETLRQHGLKGTDIKNLRDIEPFSKSWERSKTEPAKAARSSYARLLQAIQNNQVSVSILQKRLKEVHASLVRAAEKLGASEAVAAFEEEYLEFDGQARGASDANLRQKIAIKILDLERRIEILIRPK